MKIENKEATERQRIPKVAFFRETKLMLIFVRVSKRKRETIMKIRPQL